MLSIERDAALVHVTVEMDRELGEAQHGTVDLDETHFAGPQRDASGEAEVAVEPRVDEGAAVDIDADLPVPDASRIRARLHAEVRAVGVGADHDETRSGVVGDVPSDNRAAADRVCAARRSFDPGPELDATEARLVEQGCDRLRRVVRRRRVTEEVEQVGHPYSPAVSPVPRRCALSLSVSTVRSPVRAPITRWMLV